MTMTDDPEAPEAEPQLPDAPIEPAEPAPEAPPLANATRRPRLVGMPTMVMLGALGGILGVGGILYSQRIGGNATALAAEPKGVTVTTVQAAAFQATRRYVGTTQPWLLAKVGPQLVSAYVDTVLVRPGDVVAKGAVLATLDCRDASAASKAVAARARALDAMHTAAANEATRIGSLLDGKFVSQNEVDQKRAEVASTQAQVAALRAQLIGSSLKVDDCTLLAPFDGEIAARHLDPGAFVRPGSAIATVIDRHLIRISADVPEGDFALVAPGTTVRVQLLATGATVTSKIVRRAPSADPITRTTHIELDLESAGVPVWTTAELSIDAGPPVPATAIPVSAASVRNDRAKVFVVEQGVAKVRRATLVGERDGMLYVDATALPAGAQLVTQGRALLADGDRVTAKVVP